MQRHVYYYVDVGYNLREYPDRTEYDLAGVEVSEPNALVDDDTPFTQALTEKLAGVPIRPIWRNQIEDMVNELADAERHGELGDKLREISFRVHASSWIYEYRHFIHVLHETAKEFGVEL
jgi:hypothetical protein